MKKELYLYSPIYDFVAEDLIKAMNENTDEDIVVRMNTPGGNVFSGWGIIAKMIERSGKVTVKVDGAAMSMGAAILVFADDVEALDVSTIMLHRADMYVSTPEDQALLDSVNKSLRAKLEAKIDSKILKELKGLSIKDLFENPERTNLFLTAQEARKIGLVNKITKLTPKELTAFNENMFAIAAEHKNTNENQNQPAMTREELKAKFPAVYNDIIRRGKKIERKRVSAFMTYVEIDAKAVKKHIDDGDDLEPKIMAEFQLKIGAKGTLDGKASENAGAASTETEAEKLAKTKEQEGITAFADKVNGLLKLTKAAEVK